MIYLFQALASLQIPEEDFEVLFLGSVESEMKSTIAKYKKSNWRFMGHVDYYSLPDWLVKCDIGVQPSLEEGLSMVIPQMMACGVPVVITPNTGGQNIILDGENGMVVPVRDPAAIADKLAWAFRNPDLLKEMKEKHPTPSTMNLPRMLMETATHHFCIPSHRETVWSKRKKPCWLLFTVILNTIHQR